MGNFATGLKSVAVTLWFLVGSQTGAILNMANGHFGTCQDVRGLWRLPELCTLVMLIWKLRAEMQLRALRLQTLRCHFSDLVATGKKPCSAESRANICSSFLPSSQRSLCSLLLFLFPRKHALDLSQWKGRQTRRKSSPKNKTKTLIFPFAVAVGFQQCQVEGA